MGSSTGELSMRQTQSFDLEGWSALVDERGTLYDAPEWHRIMGDLVGGETKAVAVAADQNTKAVLPTYHFKQGPKNPYVHPARLFGGLTDAKDPQFAKWGPVTLLGSPTGYATTVLATDAAFWDDCVRITLNDYPDGTVFIPYLEGASAAEIAGRWSSPALLSAVRSVISVQGPTWDEHLESVKPRKRGQIKQEIRRFHRNELRMEQVSIDAADFTMLANLFAQTQAHHAVPGNSQYYVQVFEAIAQSSLARNVTIFQCNDGADVIAANLTLSYKDTLYVRTIGLDYQRTGKRAEYFNLIAHAPLQYAVENGLRQVDLGIEARRAKLQRNADPVLMWSVMFRSGVPWSEKDTHRHNASKATEILNDVGDLLDEATKNELQSLVEESP